MENILEHKRGLVEEKKAFFSSLKENTKPCAQPHLFKHMISRPDQIDLIAEIKKASPSKGLIRDDFDPVAIAQIYAVHNAAAISVLTEEKYFFGKPEYVKRISDQVNIPVLTKDFIIDEGQIYEACANGASAILLIAAILEDTVLKGLITVAGSLGLDCLVEIHNEQELERACRAGAEIIGINNRDLHTFEVDMQTCLRIIPAVPKDKIIVAESGYQSYDEIQALRGLGAHAVLIGETLMREQDIGKKINEMMLGQ